MAIILDGTSGITNVDGSAAAPAFKNQDANTGLSGSADQIVVSTGGSERFRVASAGQLGVAGANYGNSGDVLKSGGASAAPSWGSASSTGTSGTDNFTIADGNLVIGTAGHGIDFSANTHQSGMTNELLDFYEEGTWTPALSYGGNSVGLDSPVGTYIKVGNLCCVRCRMQTNSKPSGNNVNFTGLPFTASNPSGDGNAITGAVYMESCDAMITEGHPVVFGGDNSSGFDIRMSGQTGSGTSSVSDNAKSGTTYMLSVSYQTA